ncbi:MAG: hypothetical protein K5891_01020 [Lachnospiraceae bacterium]|nr:hypothetical protein [Lachnospiraceae bacterium]
MKSNIAPEVKTTASAAQEAVQVSDPNVNRQYKDRLFKFLFNDKKALLSLYNAINGTDYDDPDAIEINTIENFIYMGMKNDLSFLIASSLNLYEQQSTVNPNIPLRGFLYLSKLYQKLFGDHTDLYSSRKIPLPTPQFIVFFNGDDKEEDRRELRMSDAFSGSCKGTPALDCVTTLININYGHNAELMEKCKELKGYAILIDKIRTKTKAGMSLEDAANEAIDECISEDVLADILNTHRAEATDMILEEYNEELHIQNEKEISFAAGRESTIFSLIQDGDLSLEKGASKLDISISELEKKMTEAGYHIPESV